jgi:hypothetical protein
LLGLEQAVEPSVLRAALASESYAQSLLASRRHPQMLRLLLAAPPQRAARQAEHATAQLLRRGASALLAWAQTGFATTDPQERARRIAACLACPQRQRPGPSLLQAGDPELGVCGLCGCPLMRKVTLISETCPGLMDDDPERTRWGQTRAQGALR